MARIKIQRNGNRPLAFDGELIAEQEGPWENGIKLDRWHNIRIYRTNKGQLVLQIEYRTTWQGESDVSGAWRFTDPDDMEDDIVSLLQEHDSTESVVGYPPGEQYAEKQERLLSQIEDVWKSRVARVLDEAGFEEEFE